MTDRVTKMVNGLLPDGTLIRACEVTFDYLEKQDDRIAELKAALREIGDGAVAADRIEKLEAALEDMAQYISKADWIQLKPETHQVWDLGEIDD